MLVKTALLNNAIRTIRRGDTERVQDIQDMGGKTMFHESKQVPIMYKIGQGNPKKPRGDCDVC
jgi:hypothetical protein